MENSLHFPRSGACREGKRRAAGALSLGARVFFLSQTHFCRLYFLTLWGREGDHSPPGCLLFSFAWKVPSLLGLLNGKIRICHRRGLARGIPASWDRRSYSLPDTLSVWDVIRSGTAREPSEPRRVGALGAGPLDPGAPIPSPSSTWRERQERCFYCQPFAVSPGLLPASGSGSEHWIIPPAVPAHSWGLLWGSWTCRGSPPLHPCFGGPPTLLRQAVQPSKAH